MTIMLSKKKIISSNIPPTLFLIKRTSSVPLQPLVRNRESQTVLFYKVNNSIKCVYIQAV